MEKTLIALLLLLTFAFTACSNTPSKPINTTESESAQTTANLDENGFLKDSIPDDLNYGSKDVHILVWKESTMMVCPEDISEDVLQKTTFERNLQIEQRLGINLEFTTIPGNWQNKEGFINAALNSNLSGTGEYDAICAYSVVPMVLAMRGILLNMNELEYPQIEMPWYPDVLEDYMIHNTLFYLTDNSSGRILREGFVTYYNRNMITDYNLEDPIELTIQGKWTIDKLKTMSANIYSDLNNNSTVDKEDQFGLVVDDPSRLDAYFYGSGLNLITINSAGDPEFTFDSNKEKIISYLDKMIEIYSRKDSFIDSDSRETLNDGRTLFFTGGLLWVEQLESNEYGVIPVPKWDESQISYRTMASNGIDLWCIPSDAEDPEMSGVIIEAVASGSYRTVAPEYYDQMLKYRYSDSETGVSIFDTIRQSVIYDFGRWATLGFNGAIPDAIFRLSIMNKSNDFVSRWESSRSSYLTNLAVIIKAYKEASQN